MPPRFAYWTILIDNAPTAFRARDPQELLPTLNQLKRKNKDVTMKWFARGRLWESQEQEREDFQRRKQGPARTAARRERDARGKDWRPGGQHKDPRARFDKQKQRRDHREQRQAEPGGQKPRFTDRRPTKFSDRRRTGDRRPTGRQKPFGGPDSRNPGQRSFNRPKGGLAKQIGRRGPDSRPREEIRNKSKDKWRSERPQREERRDERRDERREQPERKEQEPPPPRPDRRTDVPEPPPKPEQIVIKPEPPERG